MEHESNCSAHFLDLEISRNDIGMKLGIYNITNGNRRNCTQYIQNTRKIKKHKELYRLLTTLTSKSATCVTSTVPRITPLKEKRG